MGVTSRDVVVVLVGMALLAAGGGLYWLLDRLSERRALRREKQRDTQVIAELEKQFTPDREDES